MSTRRSPFVQDKLLVHNMRYACHGVKGAIRYHTALLLCSSQIEIMTTLTNPLASPPCDAQRKTAVCHPPAPVKEVHYQTRQSTHHRIPLMQRTKSARILHLSPTPHSLSRSPNNTHTHDSTPHRTLLRTQQIVSHLLESASNGYLDISIRSRKRHCRESSVDGCCVHHVDCGGVGWWVVEEATDTELRIRSRLDCYVYTALYFFGGAS